MLIEDLDTPALLLDIDAVDRNIAALMELLGDGPCGVRAHFKSHRIAEVARRQIAAGAHGVTCAKLAEAEALADEGFDHFLIANQIVGETKWRRLALLAERVDVLCGVDHPDQLAGISRAAAEVGSIPGVVAEVDIGMRRCGVAPRRPAVELARLAAETPHVSFRGVMGYEGHLVMTPPVTKTPNVRAAIRLLTDTADEIRADGIPVEVVSAGGTGSYAITARCPGVTELQCGTYAVMDTNFRERGGAEFDYALTVLATIISRPAADRAVVDAGRKSCHPTFGVPQVLGLPQAHVQAMHSEHGLLTLEGPARALRVGDRLRLIPNYAEGTTNLYDECYAVRGDEVIDRWPVTGRGKST